MGAGGGFCGVHPGALAEAQRNLRETARMTSSRTQVAIAMVIFAIAVVLPIFLRNDYLLQVIFRVFLFAALGLAWNLVGGYAGQLSLGHAAYFGVGAYGLALFAKAGLNPW